MNDFSGFSKIRDLNLGPLAKKSLFEIEFNRANDGDLSWTSMGIFWCIYSQIKRYNFENPGVFSISFFAHKIWPNYRTTCKLHTFTRTDKRHILSPHSTSGLVRFLRSERVDPLFFGPISRSKSETKILKKIQGLLLDPSNNWSKFQANRVQNFFLARGQRFRSSPSQPSQYAPCREKVE